MLTPSYPLLSTAVAMFATAVAIVAYDLRLALRTRRGLTDSPATRAAGTSQWRITIALLAIAWTPLLVGLSFVLSPNRKAGV